MFPALTLSGAPRERGRQYGRAAAPLVRHSLASYARLFAFWRGLDWGTVRTMAERYLPALGEIAPHVLEEIRGIAEGAELPLADVLALNVRTELLAGQRRDTAHPSYTAAVARNRAAGLPEHGECTTVAALPGATADGATLLAQTWDWSGDQRAACVVLRIAAPGRPDILTVTEAGIVAKIGMNSAGLAVSLNILASQSDGREPGMPVHVLLRMLLELESVADAQALAEQHRAAASSCVTAADSGGSAVSLEITPGGVGVIAPENGLLTHTNHCLLAETRSAECPLPAASSSLPRYDQASRLLAARRGRIDAEALIAVLRDHEGGAMAICRHPDPSIPAPNRVESVLGVVMEPGAGVMHLAADVPCLAPFETVSL